MKIILTTNPIVINRIYQLDVNIRNKYLLILDEDIKTYIGLFEIQPITKITGILHMHVSPEFQKKGNGIKAFNALMDYLKDKEFKQLIGTIPVKNNKIMSVVNKTEAKCIGLIRDGIIFDDVLQDLALYQIEVI